MRIRLLLIALLGLPLSLPAQDTSYSLTPTPAAWRSQVAAARQLLVDSMARANIPGVSVTVMKDGKVIWSEGFGYADLEERVPVTPLTRFRVGSISKAFTAAAVGQLWEGGKLDLDAPVQRYVPSFPEKRWPITTREVAGHLAGIRHYRGNEFLRDRHYNSVTAGLAIFEHDSLLFEPGTRYHYSTYGYALVSAVVEGASGEPYLGYMREHVFLPLGMIHTVAEFPDSLIPWRARFYTRNSAGPEVNAPPVDNSYKWAGGGFISTTEDLVRYGEAYLEPGFLAPQTIQLLWTSQHTRDGKRTGYGIGWAVGQDSAGHRVISHSGGSVGGTAMLLIYPDERLIVALLTNTDQSFVGIAWRLAGEFL